MARKVNITCRYYLVKKYTDTDNEKEALFDLQMGHCRSCERYDII